MVVLSGLINVFVFNLETNNLNKPNYLNMEIFRILIVDDSTDAQDSTEKMLKEIINKSELKLYRAGNVETAHLLCRQKVPDLILLDIELDGETGFDLIKILQDESFEIPVIFVTAHDEFTIKAIKYAAIDYLLKPVDPDELAAAMGRFFEKQRKSEKARFLKLLSYLESSPKLKFNVRAGCIFIRISDIFYCQAEGNYTLIHTVTGDKELVVMQIGSVLSMLPRNMFLRAGRSLILNKEYLAKVDRRKKIIEMKHSEIPVELRMPNGFKIDI
ncbi:MAG TPA: LytTR family DNA-binding domain-containing protein [Bacteroidales bacterium]|nr:LytTR family DNA-binding domain-containing protein [Bacteroidales bacterium]